MKRERVHPHELRCAVVYRDEHGGIGAESAHKPSPDRCTLRCNSAKITFSGAYFGYHQHQRAA